MIDLSNNNESVSFPTVHAHHQYRVYLKRSEGKVYADPTFEGRYRDALQAKMLPGAYHFARPSRNSAREEADFFLRLLPKLIPGRTLRPCLDLEDPDETPSRSTGLWATEWLGIVYRHLGRHPILYGSPYYLQACAFERVPCGLWLASYGRNDGKEYAYSVPRPWTRHRVLAHQFASTARVPGVTGPVDISHVVRPLALTVHRFIR